MSNKVLDYLSIVWAVVEGFDSACDQRQSDADDGEDTTVEEGKSQAIDAVDGMVKELETLRTDIKKLSLKALKEKYK